MDFKTQQNNIKEYIEEHLPSVLTSMNLANMDAYIDDFLDLDQYSKSKQLFYNFSYYNYDFLSNESESEIFEFSVYLVFRKDNSDNLRDNMLDYATAFYKMFEDSGCNLGGIADYGRIETVQFYPAAEGYPKVKIAELTIRLHTEVDA